MILKVGRTNGGGWCFYSDIYELDSELIRYEEIGEDSNDFMFTKNFEKDSPTVLLNIGTYFIDLVNIEGMSDGEQGRRGLCRHIRFKSGGENSYKHIALDTEAFLLNDTGSTIERIN